jgi:hypothetical protein
MWLRLGGFRFSKMIGALRKRFVAGSTTKEAKGASIEVSKKVQ